VLGFGEGHGEGPRRVENGGRLDEKRGTEGKEPGDASVRFQASLDALIGAASVRLSRSAQCGWSSR
jgi:hypothetical protein